VVDPVTIISGIALANKAFKEVKQLLENDKTLDQELLMAIGGYDPNGDGKVDPQEKENFINAVTNHNDPNFNLEVSKKILAEKMTNVVENGHAAHWAKQAEGAAAKQAAEMQMKLFENQLRVDLDNAKTENDRKLAYDKYKMELDEFVGVYLGYNLNEVEYMFHSDKTVYDLTLELTNGA